MEPLVVYHPECDVVFGGRRMHLPEWWEASIEDTRGRTWYGRSAHGPAEALDRLWEMVRVSSPHHPALRAVQARTDPPETPLAPTEEGGSP